MQRQEFFARLLEVLKTKLPEPLRDFDYRTTNSLIKIFYAGNPRIHYEVWFQARTNRLELGLHFEDEKETNDRLFSYFDQRFLDVITELGPSIDVERWTKSWSRIHRSLPLAPASEALVEEVASQLSEMIEVLEPMLREGLAKSARSPST